MARWLTVRDKNLMCGHGICRLPVAHAIYYKDDPAHDHPSHSCSKHLELFLDGTQEAVESIEPRKIRVA